MKTTNPNFHHETEKTILEILRMRVISVQSNSIHFMLEEFIFQTRHAAVYKYSDATHLLGLSARLAAMSPACLDNMTTKYTARFLRI
jgi:hypothetical protein